MIGAMDLPQVPQGGLPLATATPSASAVASPTVAPVSFRRFDDIVGQRKLIYQKSKSAFSQLRPVENANYRLELADVGYEEEDDAFDPQPDDEKQFILKRGSLARPIKGTLRLVNAADGSVVDEQRATLANIPHLNSRGLFIRKGVVWGLRNQLRLRPGIYSRRKANGELESHFNIKPGTGRGFRTVMDPETGVFKLQIGQSTTKLFPLLRSLGVPDEQIKEAWGEELYNKNFRVRSGNDYNDMRKVLSKLGSPTVQVDDDALLAPALREVLEKAEVDEETTELTLGERISKLSPERLLQATGKMLKIARGEARDDNRDSQAFQTIHSPEDLIEERLRRDQAGTLRKLLWKATKTGKLGNVQPGLLNENLNALFEKSGLGATVEDINPFEIYDLRQAVSRLGEGGIASEESVSRDARGVQASYIGTIDAGRGPECYDDQTQVMTERGWLCWKDVTALDKFACLVDGVLQFHPPVQLYRAPYTGVMYGARTSEIDYLVTPNHRMYSRTDGLLRDGRKCGFKFTTPDYFEERTRVVLSAGFEPVEYSEAPTSFYLPLVEAEGATKAEYLSPPVGARLKNHTAPIDMEVWAAFMGWYLSEGSVYVSKASAKKATYCTKISQTDSEHPEKMGQIQEVLDKLPFVWNYSARSFNISGKQLALYLKRFGTSSEKYIPEYILRASVAVRKAFVKAFLAGDGKHWHGTEDIRTLHTTSPMMAAQFERLMFSLGRSTRTSVTVDNRRESYHAVYGVYIHTRDTHAVTPSTRRRKTPACYRTHYSGEVFCATVPGGLLYVRRNNSIGFWCGNSGRLGLDLRVTDAALKGSDGLLYTRVRNTKTGEIETVSARDLAKKTVAFPGEWDKDGKRIPVVREDSVDYATRDEVDYEILSPGSLMSRATAMIPFPEAMKGQRLLMGSRMTQQALPIRDAEAPLVQTADADGNSMHGIMGEHMGARKSPVGGVVTEVTPSAVKVRTEDGKERVIGLYNNYPLARKTFLTNEAIVRPGDVVSPGMLVAKSNFTDKDGTTAIGKNLRVAWMSAAGSTIEDAIVVSESAARKMMSEGMYKTDLDLEDVRSTGKGDYTSVYPDKFTREQLNKIDDDGVVQVGQEVRTGDPLVLAMSDKKGRAIGALMQTPKSSVSNNAKVWDHNAPGVVTDVEKTRKGIRVTVKTYDPTHLADKLTTRFGAKGVVSEIRPDDQMPTDEQGRPIEMIMNAFGVISRVNPAALAEALLGKAAEKRGKPYVISGFSTGNVADFAIKEALKHGVVKLDEDGKLVDTETLTDPRDGRKIPNIFVGNSYVMKLHHTAESKLSARDQAGYTQEGFPAKGGPTGCFVAKQTVMTINGPKEIARICEKRISEQVLTWSNDLEEWVYRPITDWFTYRAKVEDIIAVDFVGPTRDGSSYRHTLQSIVGTKNHVVYTPGGDKKLLGQISVGDSLVSYGVIPSRTQLDILMGSLLGDASIHESKQGTLVYQCEHSLTQERYFNWKVEALAGVVTNWVCGRHNGWDDGVIKIAPVKSKLFYFTHPHITKPLYNAFYTGPGGTKRITRQLLDSIGDIGFAIWLLDDGCISSRGKRGNEDRLIGSIATQGFSYSENLLIAEYLTQRYGEKATVRKCKNGSGYFVGLSVPLCKIFVKFVSELLASQVLPDSKRVLARQMEKLNVKPTVVIEPSRLGCVEVYVRSIRNWVPDKQVDEVNVYDFTVADTHSYCAGSVLVSNSKRIGVLDSYSLISAGATEFLKDAKLIRGQRNDDYWRAIRNGETAVAPEKSLANEVFRTQLISAGVNLRDKGTRTGLAPLLDKDVDTLASKEITSGETFSFDSMEPIEGGLFDKTATGGADGNKFAKITLPKKIPHPLFVEPIQRLLGLTGKEMQEVLAGRSKFQGSTGPEAIENALSRLNIDQEMAATKEQIRNGSRSKRDEAVKKLNYLTGLKKFDIAASDLMVSKVPVIPPKYRPITRARGTEMVHDLNFLYKDLLTAKENYEQAVSEFGDAGDEYLTLMNAVQAISGVKDPVNPKSVEQGVGGILRHAIGVGKSPKYATFQRKVIGSAVDTVGRGTITADSSLDMDEVSIPADIAWTTFKPFILRRLTRNGYSATEALKHVKERTPTGLKALKDEMGERPVVYNRAPSLHKYSYVGAWGKLREKDDGIGLPYHVLKGIGGDYDGDNINIHVPSSEEAVKEVKDRLFPSKNLFHTATFESHLEPVQDYLAGLYLATRPKKGEKVQAFPTLEAAQRAFAKGEISMGTPIRIMKS